jgi:hypothetical protein
MSKEQLAAVKAAVGYHFSRRHQAGNSLVRSWIEYYRRHA